MSGDSQPENADKSQNKPSTFYLPTEAGCGDCEAGDVIELKVVGKTPDGELEVQRVSDDDGDEGNWKTDLKNHMASADTGANAQDQSYGS